jgi:hypothetical protein
VARHSLYGRFWSAVDLLVAFATLADPGEHPHELADAPALHPHCRPLRSRKGPRRPNSASPTTHHCVTPLGAPTRRRHAPHSSTA